MDVPVLLAVLGRLGPVLAAVITVADARLRARRADRCRGGRRCGRTGGDD